MGEDEVEAIVAALVDAMLACEEGGEGANLDAQQALIDGASPEHVLLAAEKVGAMGGRPQDRRPDTDFTYFQITPAYVPGGATDGPARPNWNADLERVIRGRTAHMGAGQLRGLKQMLMTNLLVALTSGKTGYPARYQAGFANGGGPVSGANFLHDGKMRVPNTHAHFVLGEDGLGGTVVVTDAEGVDLAVRVSRSIAPYKPVLTMVSGLPANASRGEVFTFFKGILHGHLAYGSVRRAEDWTTSLTSAQEGQVRVRAEELAAKSLNWSSHVPFLDQISPGGSANGRSQSYYLSTRHDLATLLPSRLVMVRPGGESVTLSCSGEAVRGCGKCGARDHTGASCSGRGVGWAVPRFNSLGERVKAPQGTPTTTPPRPSPGPRHAGAEEPEWEEVGSRRRPRKSAGQLQVQQHGNQHASHQRGHKQHAKPASAPVHSGSGLRTTFGGLKSGVSAGATLTSVASKPPRLEPTSILLPPRSTSPKTFAEAARSSPLKPGVKRVYSPDKTLLALPPSSSAEPSLSSRMDVVPSAAESASHLGLAVNHDGSLTGESGGSSGVLLGEPGAERAHARRRTDGVLDHSQEAEDMEYSL